MGPAERGLGRKGAALVSVSVALVLALGPDSAGAATVSSAWKAKIGSDGANGTATIQGYATGTGGLVLKLAKLKPATLMPVTLYKGTCSAVGAVLIRVNAVKTTSTGTAVRMSGLTATQVNAIKAATKSPAKVAIRVGTGSAMKCGVFAALVVPPTLGLVGLRYRLVDQLGRPLFCDPDLHPVARGDESQLAQQHYPEIRSDVETYRAITGHLEIGAAGTPSTDQVLAIYREWKMLRALALTQAGGAYQFDYVAAAISGANQGWHVSGTIGATGTISLDRRDPSGPPPCPICLARGTTIATPDGPVAVEDLQAGMVVWTSGESDARVPAQVLLIGSTLVPATHLVVHLVLADGRALVASPGHPLPDRRRLGDLRPGDVVDGSIVVAAELVPYAGVATYDLLPAGPTGTYWADGILLASTLGSSGRGGAERRGSMPRE